MRRARVYIQRVLQCLYSHHIKYKLSLSHFLPATIFRKVGPHPCWSTVPAMLWMLGAAGLALPLDGCHTHRRDGSAPRQQPHGRIGSGVWTGELAFIARHGRAGRDPRWGGVWGGRGGLVVTYSTTTQCQIQDAELVLLNTPSVSCWSSEEASPKEP